MHRCHQNNSNFNTDGRKNPATRGGQRGVLNFSVSSPYPKRIQPSTRNSNGRAMMMMMDMMLVMEEMEAVGAVDAVEALG